MLIKIEWMIVETIYEFDYLFISGLNSSVHHHPEMFTGNVVATNLFSSGNSLKLHFHSDAGGTTNLGKVSQRESAFPSPSRLPPLLQTMQNARFRDELR